MYLWAIRYHLSDYAQLVLRADAVQLVAERHKLYLALLRVILLNQRVVGTLRVEVVDGRSKY